MPIWSLVGLACKNGVEAKRAGRERGRMTSHGLGDVCCMIGRYSNVSKTNLLHVDIFCFFSIFY
jgi:hypothetical protein